MAITPDFPGVSIVSDYWLKPYDWKTMDKKGDGLEKSPWKIDNSLSVMIRMLVIVKKKKMKTLIDIFWGVEGVRGNSNPVLTEIREKAVIWFQSLNSTFKLWIYLSIYLSIYLIIFLCRYVCIHVCMYVCMCLSVNIYLSIYLKR